MTPRRRRAFRVLGVLGGTLLGVVCAELLGRQLDSDVFLQQRMRGGGLFVPYSPDTEADLLADEFRVRFRINAHGHRDRADREEARTPGRDRVLLLGDSFSVGWGVEQEATTAARLEAQLDVDVVNASASGGCPLWYVAQLRDLQPRFRPDLLLVQVYDNDPDDSWVHKERFGLQPGARLGELPAALRRRDGVDASLSRFVRELVLRRRLRAAKKWLNDEPIQRSPFVRPGALADHVQLDRAGVIAKHGLPTGRDGAQVYHQPVEGWRERFELHRRLLGQLFEEARARDLPVVVLYVPNYQLFLYGEPPAQLRARNPHSALLAEVCAEAGVSLLDGVELLGAAKDPALLYFPYDGHLNADGHERLAEAIAPRIRELLAR